MIVDHRRRGRFFLVDRDPGAADRDQHMFSREFRGWHWEMVFNRLLGNGWSDHDDFIGRHPSARL